MPYSSVCCVDAGPQHRLNRMLWNGCIFSEKTDKLLENFFILNTLVNLVATHTHTDLCSYSSSKQKVTGVWDPLHLICSTLTLLSFAQCTVSLSPSPQRTLPSSGSVPCISPSRPLVCVTVLLCPGLLHRLSLSSQTRSCHHALQSTYNKAKLMVSIFS